MSIIDAKAIIVEGKPFTVKIVRDDLSRIDDADCYDKVNRRYFERDEWQFVGVVVVDEETGNSDSVWAVEYGTMSPEVSISVSDIAGRDDIYDMAKGLL